MIGNRILLIRRRQEIGCSAAVGQGREQYHVLLVMAMATATRESEKSGVMAKP